MESSKFSGKVAERRGAERLF